GGRVAAAGRAGGREEGSVLEERDRRQEEGEGRERTCDDGRGSGRRRRSGREGPVLEEGDRRQEAAEGGAHTETAKGEEREGAEGAEGPEAAQAEGAEGQSSARQPRREAHHRPEDRCFAARRCACRQQRIRRAAAGRAHVARARNRRRRRV